MTCNKFPSISSRINLASGLFPLFIASLVLALFASDSLAQEPERTPSPVPDLALDLTHPATSNEVASTSLENPGNQPPLSNGESNEPVTQQGTDQPDTPATPDELREQLQIEPLLDSASLNFYHPGSGAGIPEAFGSEWGDVFITVSGASKDKIRRTYIDSAISMGFGLGDARDLVGVELAYNILSTRTSFAVNGSFDVKVHRHILDNTNFLASAALGVINFYSYGPEAGINPPVAYGVLSGVTYLRPNDTYEPMPLTLTLGAGGAPYFAENGVGLIAGAGVEVHPQIGLGSSWNGTGFSLGASFVPFRNIPLTLNALYQDIFNMTAPGHKLILSLDYSYSFK